MRTPLRIVSVFLACFLSAALGALIAIKVMVARLGPPPAATQPSVASQPNSSAIGPKGSGPNDGEGASHPNSSGSPDFSPGGTARGTDGTANQTWVLIWSKSGTGTLVTPDVECGGKVRVYWTASDDGFQRIFTASGSTGAVTSEDNDLNRRSGFVEHDLEPGQHHWYIGASPDTSWTVEIWEKGGSNAPT